MTGQLQLKLLGKLEICQDGKPVANLTSAKAQALLCYLAVTGRPHFRTSLAGLLWPDMPDTNARANLRRELSTLRGTLGDHLLISRHEVALNRDAHHWLDVEAFEAAADQGTIEALQEATDLYRGDFLEGFYVREAADFEEWVLVLRNRLRERALQGLHKLAAHYAAQGEQGFEGGIAITSRLLALEPSREEAHRQLMSLLAQSGQRGAALAQYELCRQALAEDLGVEPGPKTQELYQRIRDGDVGRRSAGRRSVRSAPLRDAGAKTLSSRTKLGESGAKTLPRSKDLPAFLADDGRPEPDRPVFVARERELARLDGYLEQALSGKGQVVFITGGPGRGKTALITEFARRAMDRHPELLLGMGSCNAFSGVGDPYLPFREVLAMLTGDLEARCAAGAISRAHASRLWVAVPQVLSALLDHGPYLIGSLLSGPSLLSRASVALDDAGVLDQLRRWTGCDLSAQSDLQQDAVFEQFTNVLRALAGQRPLVLMLDDLQWVDNGSTSLAFHLGRRLADNGGRILILGTYRPEELAIGDTGGRHPLEKVLHELERRFGDIYIDLSTSDAAQGTRFVDALLDSPTSPLARNRLDGGFRAALAQHTGGHALFTTEVLRDLQERGDLSQDAQGYWIASPTLDWGQLPPRVEAVIEERVDRLAPELRQLLQVASVEGERFTAQVVAQVQDLGERHTLRTLSEELGARHRLVRDAGEEHTGEHYLSRYQFAHVLFQAYLYDGLSSGERRLLHREVGSSLEALYEGHTEEIAAQLASHFSGAGDTERERRYAKMAGERAAAVFAWQEAVRYLSRALDLTPEGDRDERFKVLLTRESMNGFHGDRKSQAADLAILDELAEGPEDDQQTAARRAMATLRRARYAEATFDLPAGIKLSQAAIEYARTAGDRRAEGEGYWNWGLVLHKQKGAAEAQLRFEQGLVLARQTNCRWLEAACMRAIGGASRDQGYFKAAKTYFQDALSTSREIGDLEGEALALWHLGLTSAQEDNTATAIDFLQQAAAFSSRTGYRPVEAAALNSLGWNLIRQSHYTEAQSCLERALHIYREIENPGGQADALNGLGRLHREYTGGYERSRACGEEASRLCQALGIHSPPPRPML